MYVLSCNAYPCVPLRKKMIEMRFSSSQKRNCTSIIREEPSLVALVYFVYNHPELTPVYGSVIDAIITDVPNKTLTIAAWTREFLANINLLKSDSCRRIQGLITICRLSYLENLRPAQLNVSFALVKSLFFRFFATDNRPGLYLRI